MPAYLLTVESAERLGELVRVLPAVPIRRLIEQQPGMLMPMPGDPLELRLPGGETRSVPLGVFGVETRESGDGALYTTSDPADPVLTLRIGGEVRPDEVPAGTEVWLAQPRYQP
jgi:hypothetical protein